MPREHPTFRRIRRCFHKRGHEVQIREREPGLEIQFQPDNTVVLAQCYEHDTDKTVWHILPAARPLPKPNSPDPVIAVEVDGTLTDALAKILELWRDFSSQHPTS